MKKSMSIEPMLVNGILALKTANVKLPRTYLDVMHIIKLADRIFEVALVKDRAVYNKLINLPPKWGKRIL